MIPHVVIVCQCQIFILVLDTVVILWYTLYMFNQANGDRAMNGHYAYSVQSRHSDTAQKISRAEMNTILDRHIGDGYVRTRALDLLHERGKIEVGREPSFFLCADEIAQDDARHDAELQAWQDEREIGVLDISAEDVY